MRTNSILILAFIALVTLSCKDKKKEPMEDFVESYSVRKLPNKSDEYFSKAISDLELGKNNEAAEQIEKGLTEIEKEGEDVSVPYKTNFEKAKEALGRISSDLKKDKKVSANTLSEVIANAEINIAHEYLSSSDFYVFDEPKEMDETETTRNFYKYQENLKKMGSKVKDDAKKDWMDLTKEGNKLDEEYQVWKKKAKEHNNKALEHMKKYDSQYYEEGYYF